MFFRITVTIAAICLGVQAFARSRELSASDAIRQIRQEFLGYSSFEGSDGDQRCKIQVLKLEGVFGGLQVSIVDPRGAMTAVSIASPEVRVFQSVNRRSEGAVMAYQILSDGSQALIQVARQEDSSDFDLTLVANDDLRSMKSCSVRE